jgi:hypothetical protein
MVIGLSFWKTKNANISILKHIEQEGHTEIQRQIDLIFKDLPKLFPYLKTKINHIIDIH